MTVFKVDTNRCFPRRFSDIGYGDRKQVNGPAVCERNAFLGRGRTAREKTGRCCFVARRGRPGRKDTAMTKYYVVALHHIWPVSRARNVARYDTTTVGRVATAPAGARGQRSVCVLSDPYAINDRY